MRSNRRACTYVVAIDENETRDDLEVLAQYLTTLGAAGCDVVVLDPASPEDIEERRRILRWVARHIPADGDLLQAATDAASTDKIIVATPDSRYTGREVERLLSLLDRFDAVEPEEFIDPLPWWGAIDASRMLLHRGLDQAAGSGRTFAFRRSAWHPVLHLHDGEHSSHLERLQLLGTEVQPAHDVFIRHEPLMLDTWARRRAGEAARSKTVPLESAIFACLLPLLVILGAVGGFRLAGTYAGVVMAVSVLIAVRGRSGASQFFPLRTCFFAPLAIIERSLSVYWSLFARVSVGRRSEPAADDIIRRHAPITSDPGPLPHDSRRG